LVLIDFSVLLQKPTVATETSQIQAPTPKNTYGFKIASQEMAQVKAVDEVTVLLGISQFRFQLLLI